MYKMVDVCKGKMTLAEVEYEIQTIMAIYRPNRLIIDIGVVDKVGYITTFWITKQDFQNPKRGKR